jgi:hypothetical protein
MPVILVTQEAAIRKIMVQSQLGAKSLQDPVSQKPIPQKQPGGVARGVGPEFKSQYQKVIYVVYE